MKPFLVQVPVDRVKKLKYLILLNEMNQENHSKEWSSMQGKKKSRKYYSRTDKRGNIHIKVAGSRG